MVIALQSHPSTPSDLVKGVQVDIEWKSPETLWLRYLVDCPVDNITLPSPAEPGRMDNLWQTTCFELFLREPGAAQYCEFNFSPSSQWAAYGFTDFRAGFHNLEMPVKPVIAPLDAGDSYLAQEVDITLSSGHLYPRMLAAISAVIIDGKGSKSYWGYGHPEGKPDFHHMDCFAIELTPPVKS